MQQPKPKDRNGVDRVGFHPTHLCAHRKRT